eukprot:Skav200435  [mRNA]  locus=scaffold578:88706:89929:- [translate_table: standard]
MPTWNTGAGTGTTGTADTASGTGQSFYARARARSSASVSSVTSKIGPPPSAAVVRLNRALSSSDLPSILSICAEKLNEFDNVNRVTALHRIARTKGPADHVTGVTDQLLKDLHEQLAELKIQQLANTFWSLGRLHLAQHPMCEAIAMRGARDVQEFGAQECANFFWACGKMLWKNDMLLEALSRHSSQIVFEMLPQHLGNIAWCMAKTKYVDIPLVDAITAKAMESIPTSDQQEISNLV